MKNDLLATYPSMKHKTSVIYNPVNQLVEDYGKSIEHSAIEKQNYILCVGRLEKQKAFHYAIRAFAIASESHPTLRLKIIGKGTLEIELKSLANDLNIADKIDFEGFKQETIPYYLQAKAVLLTSLYEGFPNVLIESITLGTPIVAFDCKSGPNEIIKEGINGFLVEAANINEAANALNLLLSAPMIKKNICESSKKYHVSNIIADWQRFLISI
jgi:glycosyltransferase involved in cell wall biosynthesis